MLKKAETGIEVFMVVSIVELLFEYLTVGAQWVSHCCRRVAPQCAVVQMSARVNCVKCVQRNCCVGTAEFVLTNAHGT